MGQVRLWLPKTEEKLSIEEDFWQGASNEGSQRLKTPTPEDQVLKPAVA